MSLNTTVTGITLNGHPVPRDCYTVDVKTGAITFKPEFLESLPNGEHEIVIETSDGKTQSAYSLKIEVTNTFEATPSPKPTTEPGEDRPTPTPTRRPSSPGGVGGGGGGGNSGEVWIDDTSSNFGTSATTAPGATAKPAATARPETEGTPSPDSGEPTTAETTAVFEDVPVDFWAYEYIMKLYNSGVINGETPTLFVPDDLITRAEFTKIAVILFGIMPNGTPAFEDVDPNEWYAPYIAAAQARGIVNGTSDVTFSPDDSITREQIAVILYRHAAANGADASADISGYTDAAYIDDYAADAVRWACGAGILNGYEDGSIRPLSNATRAEAAAMMARYGG